MTDTAMTIRSPKMPSLLSLKKGSIWPSRLSSFRARYAPSSVTVTR